MTTASRAGTVTLTQDELDALVARRLRRERVRLDREHARTLKALQAELDAERHRRWSWPRLRRLLWQQ